MAVVGVGIDLVDIARAGRLLSRHGDRALHRLLLPAERTYVLSMAHPERHFAARLAGKEAVYKALALLHGASRIMWRDIEVIRDRRGRPGVTLHGAAHRVASTVGTYHVRLSLTHTDATAGAVAVVEAL